MKERRKIKIFVFGALMRSELNRTGGRAALVPDHEVRFIAEGVRFLEPAFAALVPARGSTAHGVVYDVDRATWLQVLRAEDGYEERVVNAIVEGEAHEARALFIRDEDRLSEARVPSKRYLRILIQGARAHGLPEEYIQCLEELSGRASSTTLVLSFLRKPVGWLTPVVGLGGAMIATALGVLTLVFAVVWLLMRAIGGDS